MSFHTSIVSFSLVKYLKRLSKSFYSTCITSKVFWIGSSCIAHNCCTHYNELHLNYFAQIAIYMDSWPFLHLLSPTTSTCGMYINNAANYMIALECSSLYAPIDASFGDSLMASKWFGWLSRDWHSDDYATSYWQYVEVICFMGLLLNFHLGNLTLHNHGYYIMGTITWTKLNGLA